MEQNPGGFSNPNDWGGQPVRPPDKGNFIQSFLGTSEYMKQWRKERRQVSDWYVGELGRVRSDFKRREREIKQGFRRDRDRTYREFGIMSYEQKNNPQAAQKKVMEKLHREQLRAEKQVRAARNDRTKVIRLRLRGVG
ncbi:MAG: hypothetical protein Q8P73_05425 [bacterium]|nr:hypothetical protein [bacterium]